MSFSAPLFWKRLSLCDTTRKKDSDFSKYATDRDAIEARRWIIDRVLTECVLVTPDWEAASRPWESGRPFEGFLDASDLSWCVALCQRDKPGGTPRLIAFICKSFSDEATRWSAFEREFFCFKEGYAAIAKYVTGFKIFMYFDNKNIERAEVCLKSRRASKKLLNWVADSQEFLANVVRVCIDGKYNVLPEVGSRLPWETALAKHLPVPLWALARPCSEVVHFAG